MESRIILDGEMVLKFYYDVCIGEGMGGTISATGTYTIKLFGAPFLPLTKNLNVRIKILIPGESINVWYEQTL